MSEGRAARRRWVWAGASVILAALVAAVILWGQPVYGFLSDQEQIGVWTEGFGAWGPVAIILLTILQVILAPIPGQAIQAAGGYLYGPWLGTLYSMIGLVIGSLIAFWLARRFGRPLAVRLVGQRSMARLDDLIRRGGALFFFLLWLFPFTPDDLACLAAGLTPMPTGQFLVLMTVARGPGILIAVLVGANVVKIQPLWWLVLFGTVAVVALILWRWKEPIQQAVLGFIERLGARFWA